MRSLLLILLILIATVGWSQNRVTQGAQKTYTVRLKAGEAAGAVYSWKVAPANGTSTNLGEVNQNNCIISWDGLPGTYTLTVQVTDGNGCVSESISQTIEILLAGSLVFDSALPSTLTCSELSGGKPGNPAQGNQSFFRITYSGDTNLLSAKITVKNPEGLFTDLNGVVLASQENPEIVVAGETQGKSILFALTDNWENTSLVNTAFRVTLVSAITADHIEIAAVAGTDIVRTVTVLPKPKVEFE